MNIRVKLVALAAALTFSAAAFAFDPGNYGAPFKPQNGASANAIANSITVAGLTASATSGTLPTRDNEFKQLQIANTTASWAYVNLGGSSVTAATVANSYPVAPGAVVVVTVELYVTTVSVIMGTANGNVIFTLGSGA